LRIADPERGLKFLPDAIAHTKKMLGGRVPLIGFTGSPWTLACYMVEGGATKDFRHIKRMMLDEPQTLKLLLEKLIRSVRLSLEAQLAAGADAVQIFDTWGGVLTPDHFRAWSLDPLFGVLGELHKAGSPVIAFCKGANHALEELSEIGADVVGVDWTVDIGEARRLVGDRVALQGNLDPAALYASPELIRHEVTTILRKFGDGPGHIFNLGHGITPDVPVDHARAMVRAVREESEVFHRS
jgi:uroporphyrinogen decarboxylase